MVTHPTENHNESAWHVDLATYIYLDFWCPKYTYMLEIIPCQICLFKLEYLVQIGQFLAPAYQYSKSPQLLIK